MDDESYHSPWWSALQKLLLIEAGLISFTGILYLLSDISFSSLLLGLGCVLIVVAAYMTAGSAKQGYPDTFAHLRRGYIYQRYLVDSMTAQFFLAGFISIFIGIIIMIFSG